MVLSSSNSSMGPTTDPAGDNIGKQIKRYFGSRPFYQEVTGNDDFKERNYESQKAWGMLGILIPFALMFLPVVARANGASDFDAALWVLPLVAFGLFAATCMGATTGAVQEGNPKVHFFLKGFAIAAPVALVIAAFFGFVFEAPAEANPTSQAR